MLGELTDDPGERTQSAAAGGQDVEHVSDSSFFKLPLAATHRQMEEATSKLLSKRTVISYNPADLTYRLHFPDLPHVNWVADVEKAHLTEEEYKAFWESQQPDKTVQAPSLDDINVTAHHQKGNLACMWVGFSALAGGNVLSFKNVVARERTFLMGKYPKETAHSEMAALLKNTSHDEKTELMLQPRYLSHPAFAPCGLMLTTKKKDRPTLAKLAEQIAKGAGCGRYLYVALPFEEHERSYEAFRDDLYRTSSGQNLMATKAGREAKRKRGPADFTSRKMGKKQATKIARLRSKPRWKHAIAILADHDQVVDPDRITTALKIQDLMKEQDRVHCTGSWYRLDLYDFKTKDRVPFCKCKKHRSEAERLLKQNMQYLAPKPRDIPDLSLVSPSPKIQEVIAQYVGWVA
jgi:hypothetical protein